MNIELEEGIKEVSEEMENSDNSDFRTSLTNKEQHKILFDGESSSLYSETRKESNYDYDYEVNSIKLKEEKIDDYKIITMYIQEKAKDNNNNNINYIKIDPSETLHDCVDIPYDGDPKILNPNNTFKKEKANCFKKLVSKKKRRLQTEFFDLDMSYITERVIGMGFPSTGCETFYRNSLEETRRFLDKYHREYKIYNLCIEKDRIYPKNYFFNRKVGLFPFNDHAPCPIKLILDFCVDICLYLSMNPGGVAAIHCKAGKGRTGVMIVCYLFFSGLCQTVDEALRHYAKQRTLNNKGVTIASQIRYIRYFESFLCANYEKPYIKCIPKIIKYDLNKGYKNMILNYNTDMSYFATINSFKLKSCLIGPFQNDLHLTYDFGAITKKKLNLDSYIYKSMRGEGYYYEINFNSENSINYDLKLVINGKDIKFYSWFNLWYATFEIISEYVIENKYFEDEEESKIITKNQLSEINTVKENDSNNEIKNYFSNDINSSIENYEGKNRRKTVSMSFYYMKAKHKKGVKRRSAVQAMKNNKDLNDIIDGIDELANDKKVALIDRKNLVFTIKRKELDKLKTKCTDEFEVKYKFQLLSSSSQ
jgi:protein-tyrosine phosphatase